MKCFVGLCKDRLEGLMAAPRAPASAHARTLALLLLLLSYDISWVVRAILSLSPRFEPVRRNLGLSAYHCGPSGPDAGFEFVTP